VKSGFRRSRFYLLASRALVQLDVDHCSWIGERVVLVLIWYTHGARLWHRQHFPGCRPSSLGFPYHWGNFQRSELFGFVRSCLSCTFEETCSGSEGGHSPHSRQRGTDRGSRGSKRLLILESTLSVEKGWVLSALVRVPNDVRFFPLHLLEARIVVLHPLATGCPRRTARRRIALVKDSAEREGGTAGGRKGDQRPPASPSTERGPVDTKGERQHRTLA
jgi:hypothetical protein